MIGERKIVLELLKLYAVKVMPEGEAFTLSSGERSRYYVDVKRAAMRARCHLALASLLYNELAEGSYGAVSCVAGVALGGCHLASITALYASIYGKTSLDAVHVRKEPKGHGTKALVEGAAPGIGTVLLEDVVTTGGSTLKAMQALRLAGHEVLGTLAVVDRRMSKPTQTIDGLPFRALFDLSELLEDE
jgi:orotate phosphoribosyltransferase